jgi:NADPH2:quinone reductase
MQYIDLPDPIAPDGFELITVSAAGINYADTHQIENSYLSPQKLPLIPGIEVVGTTVSGRRVLAVVDGGGYAQKVVAHSSSLIDLPDRISDADALAMMVQGTTAFHLLRTMGHLKKGESVVVHAAAGGVGVIAVQLAKLWGAYVIAVTSSSEKAEIVKALGADVIVDSNTPDLAKALNAANGGKGVDIVLEMIGGDTFAQSFAALTPFGRMITFGNASRSATREIGGGELMHGSKTVSGFWLANCFGKKEMINDVLTELFGLIIGGKLRPSSTLRFPMSEAKAAHEAILSRKTSGKIVLDPAL